MLETTGAIGSPVGKRRMVSVRVSTRTKWFVTSRRVPNLDPFTTNETCQKSCVYNDNFFLRLQSSSLAGTEMDQNDWNRIRPELDSASSGVTFML